MSTIVDKMSSQVISYRLSTDEVLALRQKALPGESDNQTAQRLMRETLGLSTLSTASSTVSTVSLDERIESVVEHRLSSFAANQNELLSRLQERLQEIEVKLNEMLVVTELQVNQIPVDIAVDFVDEAVNIEDSATDTIVDSVDKTIDNSDRLLTQKELSERLGVHPATLSKNRSKSNFADWSLKKDPEGLAWKYLSEVERYSPVSTELSTQSTSEESDEPSLSAWKARVDEVVGAL
jgi:Tol biopolymer transport system component